MTRFQRFQNFVPSSKQGIAKLEPNGEIGIGKRQVLFGFCLKELRFQFVPTRNKQKYYRNSEYVKFCSKWNFFWNRRFPELNQVLSLWITCGYSKIPDFQKDKGFCEHIFEKARQGREMQNQPPPNSPHSTSASFVLFFAWNFGILELHTTTVVVVLLYLDYI